MKTRRDEAAAKVLISQRSLTRDFQDNEGRSGSHAGISRIRQSERHISHSLVFPNQTRLVSMKRTQDIPMN
jgi:aminoglycoside N3'-acetyltransferase